ncbi:leukocidin family pore-forming toxin [Pelagibaculum spongiae]|nr:leukocidin family pore-forming toxin [Pelagibaculum spongiae]
MKCTRKPLSVAALFISLFSVAHYANALPFDNPSNFALNYITGNLNNSVYLNLNDTAVNKALSETLTSIKQGKVVVLDSTEATSITVAHEQLIRVLGVATPAPITLVYMKDGEIVSHSLGVNSDASDFQNIDLNRLSSSLNSALAKVAPSLPKQEQRSVESIGAISSLGAENSGTAEFALSNNFGILNEEPAPKATSYLRAKSQSSVNSYTPVLNRTLIVSYDNLRCDLYNDVGFNGKSDHCRGKETSVSLHFRVSMIRSLQGRDSENAKYFRISLDETQGAGAGIHISDSANYTHTWFQSWAHRQARIGPLLENYSFFLRPTENTGDVTLHRHLPGNENVRTNYSETSSISIGASASVGATVGTDGPKIGADMGASFGFSQKRSLSFSTNEYKIENQSRYNTTDISYKREGVCKFLKGTPFVGNECIRLDWVGGQQNLFDTDRITPIAYANMKPQLDVIYRAPASKTGISKISGHSKLTITNYFADRVYSGAWDTTGSKGSSSFTYTFPHNFSVDWSHPVFQPEANVRLQSLSSNNSCLDVNRNNAAAGTQVIAYTCHGQRNQMWGLDNQERYRSRIHDNRCLNVNYKGELTIESCTTALSQKWFWDGDLLKTRRPEFSGYSIQDNGLINTATVTKSSDKSSWSPYLKEFE